MKLSLVKQLDNSFKLAYNSDFEKARKIKPGDILQCEVKKPRNYKFLKKFFSLMNLVFENQEHYNNIDHLRNDLTIAAGFYTQRTNIKGEVVTEAKSISFASMSEFEFSEFYSKMLDVVVKYFHFNKQDVINNIEQHY